MLFSLVDFALLSFAVQPAAKGAVCGRTMLRVDFDVELLLFRTGLLV